jgi:ankyrin repeat protein
MMNAEETLKRHLEAGDANGITALDSSSLDAKALASESVRRALHRAAGQVVHHRMGHRDAVAAAVALGVPCDVWTAARAGLLDEVRRLVQADGSLLEARDERGRTPLQRATLVYGVCKPCEEVADFLMDSQARVDGFSAATLGMPEAVAAALDEDPAAISMRCCGSTMLNWAVRPRRNLEKAPEVVRLLIAAGADLEDRDSDESGMTPLHHAAEWGPEVCVTLVDLLLDAGADTNAVDDRGWTALDYAQDRGRKAMAARLQAV